jgi:hypothetical protein
LASSGEKNAALRGAGVGVPVDAVLIEDPRLEEGLDQCQDPLVRDPFPQPLHQGGVVDLVETCGDVGLEDHS